jgi:predicted RNA-binding protein associated with RNAse of E/G family
MPVVMITASEWSATDLFLDVWIGNGEKPRVLDEDEFEHAVAQGWIEAGQAIAARREISAILDACESGTWPPPVVNEWTIERVSSGERQPG